MGITTLEHQKDGLAAVSIGGLTNGASPLEMAVAYATLANDGIYIEPTFYTEVKDSDNNIILSSKQETHRAYSETTAYIAKDILTEPVTGASGTAKRCAINGMDVAAKTGTSNKDKDRWLCGFTNYYTAAVWYGYDDPETVVVNGISPATLIWADAMSNIHNGLESSRFKVPSNIITATICKDSGKLAAETCTNTYAEIFEKGTIPESCEGHEGHLVCQETGLLANAYCTHTTTVYKTYLIEKEKLGLWTTEANNEETIIPDTYCEVHIKPEEPEEPEEPEISDEPVEEKPETPPVDEEPGTPEDSNNGDGEVKPEKPNEEEKDGTSTEDEEKSEGNENLGEADGGIGGSGDMLPPENELPVEKPKTEIN